ncbi:NTF2-like N-terminal transpeptidase domain-containing protein [Rhodococcus sp. NPDC058505]|uniref:NTF2-like N-terminal transpeptidase domain-containing protein n=1 Tax=unclassified Rhodococcus (in: high G+C Gram-positive bacteria) TaxID=192944 RepID=UPI003663A441
MRRARGRVRVWSTIAVAVIVLLTIGVVTAVLSRPESDAPTVLARYVAALNDGDLDAAADLTSYPNAANEVMAQAFDALAPESVTFEVNQIIDLDADSGMFNAVARWDLGDDRVWTYDVDGWIRNLSVGWRVSWNPDTFMPGLGNGRTVRLDRTDAAPPTVFDITGTPMMTEQTINSIRLDPSRTPDPIGSTVALAKAIEPVAPLITAESLQQELAAANGQPIIAVNLRDGDFAVLEDRLRAVPGVVVDGEPRLITLDRRVSGPVVDAMRGVWQANRDESAGWAVNSVEPNGNVTRLAGHQGPPGPDIRSTIEPRLQMAAEHAAVSVGTPAAIVALQPSTGAILAVAQNNQASDLGSIAFTGLYPSGSTLDLVRVAATAQNTDIEHAAKQLGLGVDYKIPGLEQKTASFVGSGPNLMRSESDRTPDNQVAVSPFGMALVAASIARGAPTVPLIAAGQPASTDEPVEQLPAPVTDQLRAIMRDTVHRGPANLLAGYGDLIGATGAEGDDRWFYGSRGDLAFAVFVQDADGGDLAVKVTDRMFTALARPAE